MNFKNFVDNNIDESIEDKGIFKAMFMSGTPGAGKSYVISKISSGSISPRIVNTDKFVEFFGNGGNVNWDEYGDRVEILNQKQLALYINSLLPLWIDGTSSDPSSMMRRVGILKSFGYDVGLLWVSTPIEDAIERASKRKRNVPKEYIEKVYKKIAPLKEYYKGEFKYFKEVKNGEGELNDKAIIDAFKSTVSFFNAPIENPIGQQLYTKMKETKKKYLIDIDSYDLNSINKLSNAWYK